MDNPGGAALPSRSLVCLLQSTSLDRCDIILDINSSYKHLPRGVCVFEVLTCVSVKVERAMSISDTHSHVDSLFFYFIGHFKSRLTQASHPLWIVTTRGNLYSLNKTSANPCHVNGDRDIAPLRKNPQGRLVDYAVIMRAPTIVPTTCMMILITATDSLLDR